MKISIKKSFAICSLILTGAASTQCFAAAAENSITFSGKLIDKACTVVVNDGTATVDLGSTAVADIATTGKTSAPKTFTVALNSCPAAGAGVPTKAYVEFEGTTDGDETYFKNTADAATAATNVAVIIKDASETAIINKDKNAAITLPTAAGDIVTDYTAMMIATADDATKGDVSTTLTYNVSYE
ncbi:type 1 fimbrial protein [Buttiauxella brennerae ATCC 51605]|uniref:Type 1 fimbrial protein n=1 Tax=Buttiauxella brennerae ATCC 51605 TaxID=1354251 RepID=A0A1B7IPV4_9ENTR|nr:fimbrial protein [Buttiauxella brennerae]OAT31772.1 type 1 fimbrial protein [Buttiauxella brennerae ATCC 51605]